MSTLAAIAAALIILAALGVCAALTALGGQQTRDPGEGT